MNMISLNWNDAVALTFPAAAPRAQVEKDLMAILMGRRFKVSVEIAGKVAVLAYDAFIEASKGLEPTDAEALAFALGTDAGLQKLNELKLAAMTELAMSNGYVHPQTAPKAPVLPLKGWTAKPQKKAKAAPKLPTLEPAVQEHLTLLLRAARQQHLDSGSNGMWRDDNILDAALKEIGEACFNAKVKEFVVPYRNSGKGNGGVSGVLIGRLNFLKERDDFHPFFIKWTEDGPADEMQMPKMLAQPKAATKVTGKTAPDAKAKREAQVAARKERDRAARVKGPTGGGKPSHKDGKKGKK